jgi:uncharacterized protein
MLWGGNLGSLEVRAEGGETRLTARFPYGARTTLAPGRHEVFAARAFAERIEAGEDVHLLSGHDYEKPLASRAAGTLTLRDTDAGLELEARVNSGTSWAADFIAAHRAGLIRGLSPGFRVPEGGETVKRDGQGLLRVITRAELFEVSAVTVPAYPQAQIEARAWEAHQDRLPVRVPVHPLNRWRA